MKRLLPITLMLVIGLLLIGGATPAQAQSGNTWRVDYFPNTNWAGSPVSSQTVGFVNFNWGWGAPAPNMPTDNWTARLTTDAFFYSGYYTFTVVADDEAAVFINGATYLDTRGKGQSGKTMTFTVPMNQQWYHIEVLFREYTETAYLFVNWTFGTTPPPPPQPGQQFPSLPPNAPDVVTQFGNYNPCRDQNIHQSNCFVSDGQWNSPNLGSIQMEPQIQSWTPCTPADQVQTFYVNPQVPQRNFKCSKTLAGWFPE
jgi:hypothetical protein